MSSGDALWALQPQLPTLHADNWWTWSIAVSTYLKSQRLWTKITGARTPESQAEGTTEEAAGTPDEDFEVDDAAIRTIILDRTDSTQRQHVICLYSAKTQWEALKGIHDGPSNNRVLALLRQFITIKLVHGGLTFTKALARLKEDELAAECQKAPASPGNVYLTGNPAGTHCYQCGSAEHWAAKCPSRKRRREDPETAPNGTTKQPTSEGSNGPNGFQKRRSYSGRKQKQRQGQQQNQQRSQHQHQQLQASYAQIAETDSGEGVFMTAAQPDRAGSLGPNEWLLNSGMSGC
ncbi:MAG: hypothetical protein M1816_004805 [Peltula sp. TS41687]|nr:MAG: hypothetical protein M1816_004805 [Peltula sp. TS41687]